VSSIRKGSADPAAETAARLELAQEILEDLRRKNRHWWELVKRIV
jgi:hypothetical protein